MDGDATGVGGSRAGRRGHEAAPDDEGAVVAGSVGVRITGEDWLDAICPFLRAQDGSWRSSSPAREHRCWATEPPAELSVLTQQRLCLVRAHHGCERFLHARELRASDLARGRPGGSLTPAAAVSVRSSGQGRARFSDRMVRLIAEGLRLPRVLVVGGLVMVVLVAGAIVLAGGGPGEAARVTPAPATAEPSRGPVDEGLRPGPGGVLWYRVRAGDTLRTIADRFGVSVRQLRQANALGDPPVLREGDEVVIPR